MQRDGRKSTEREKPPCQPDNRISQKTNGTICERRTSVFCIKHIEDSKTSVQEPQDQGNIYSYRDIMTLISNYMNKNRNKLFDDRNIFVADVSNDDILGIRFLSYEIIVGIERGHYYLSMKAGHI